jgi:hypothetical protein
MNILDVSPVSQSQIPLLESPLAQQVLPEGLLVQMDRQLQERQQMHALAQRIMERLQPGIERLVHETVRSALLEARRQTQPDGP